MNELTEEEIDLLSKLIKSEIESLRLYLDHWEVQPPKNKDEERLSLRDNTKFELYSSILKKLQKGGAA